MRAVEEIQAEIDFYTDVRDRYLKDGGQPDESPAIVMLRHILLLKWVLGDEENPMRKIAHRINAINHLGVTHRLEKSIHDTQELEVIKVDEDGAR